MKGDLSCDENLYAGHEYLLFYYARTASAITYAEMRFGAIGKKASPRHTQLVEAFCARLDAILAWDRNAVDATTDIKAALAATGKPIDPDDTAIAGHAIAADAIFVTNNVTEFERVPGLVFEDWSK